jgi:hypothetical protein
LADRNVCPTACSCNVDAGRHTNYRVRHPRRGFTLIFVGVLIFVLLGLAALVIDLGLATLARRQMQAAVNTAALEGLRFRDDLPKDWQDPTNAPPGLVATIGAGNWPQTPYRSGNVSPEWQDFREKARRWAASNVAGQALPLVPSGAAGPSNQVVQPGDTTGGIPIPQFSGGIPFQGTSFSASQQYTGVAGAYYSPNSSTSARTLQPNYTSSQQRDATSGDMVSGKYDSTSSTHTEDRTTYSRSDFTPNTDGSSTTSDPDSSFLVRMRLSSEGYDGSDAVHTSGPTVPYLFGRARTAGGPNPAATWNSIGNGITVRATAIADGRPVMSVGMLGAGFNGVTDFVLTETFWSADWDNNPATPGANGIETVGISIASSQISWIPSNASNSSVAGNTASPPNNSLFVVGQSPPGLGAAATISTTEGYTPIVGDIRASNGNSGTIPCIIGFAHVQVSMTPTGNYTLTRRRSQVASENVSVGLVAVSHLQPSVATFDVNNLFMHCFAIATPSSPNAALPLLGPALVRAIP